MENNIDKIKDFLRNKISPPKYAHLYASKNYDELNNEFLNVWTFFWKNNIYEVDVELKKLLNYFVESFLYYFIKPDFEIKNEHSIAYLKYNSIISNIIAVSDFKNSDFQLEILKYSPNNFIKLLTLYSMRNTVKFDSSKFFEVSPYHASLWYFYYTWINDYASETTFNNIVEHLQNVDDNLKLATTMFHEAYFCCTYLGIHNDKKIKNKINNILKPALQDIQINNTPNKKKVAIVTGKWVPTTAVYKSCFGFIESMKDDYDLTLIHLGPDNPRIDTSIFKEVKEVKLKGNNLQIPDDVKTNEFAFAYFTDIGMMQESIYLANMRLAPIQAAGYGHPASTYGAEIDYWIGGEHVELHDMAGDNYSERLVLIPGLGQHPVLPTFERKKAKHNKSNRIIINCSWGIKKINYPLISYLKEILDRSNKQLLFRFYVSGGALYRFNNYIPFKESIESILGKDNVEIFAEKKYDEYMELMEEGDISLDSFPYGGYNSIVDSIYLRKPFVSFEGDRFFSRAASQLLRELDLPELISTNKDEFIDITVNLINNDNYRKKLSKKLLDKDLNQTLFFSGLDKNFKYAVDYLIENHESIQNENSTEPILISKVMGLTV